MNKLALFTLLVVCGAVYAADCNTYGNATDCNAAGSCTFNTDGTTTCKNSCVGLSQTACTSDANKNNCDVVNALCSVQVDCAPLVTSSDNCTGNTACNYKAGVASSCSNNGTVLADTCKPNIADEATCEGTTAKPTGCTFVAAPLACTYKTTDQCSTLAQADCTTYCSWNATAQPKAICQPLSQDDGNKACGALTTSATCTAQAQCADTTAANQCNASATYCTANNADKTKCDTTATAPAQANCLWADAVPATCTNTSLAACTDFKVQTDCTGNAACKWYDAACANKVGTFCDSKLAQDACTATTKFCTFVQNGTCGTKTSNATILAIAGSLIALIAML